jgi:hypothetical protein
MSEPLEISVGGTPNPNAAKLTLNRTVAAKGETYRGDPAAVSAPWAKALLGIPGITGVFGINNFISINKTPDSSWETIIPQAQAALRQAWSASEGG